MHTDLDQENYNGCQLMISIRNGLKSAATMFSVSVSVSVIVPLIETFFRFTNLVIYAWSTHKPR